MLQSTPFLISLQLEKFLLGSQRTSNFSKVIYSGHAFSSATIYSHLSALSWFSYTWMPGTQLLFYWSWLFSVFLQYHSWQLTTKSSSYHQVFGHQSTLTGRKLSKVAKLSELTREMINSWLKRWKWWIKQPFKLLPNLASGLGSTWESNTLAGYLLLLVLWVAWFSKVKLTTSYLLFYCNILSDWIGYIIWFKALIISRETWLTVKSYSIWQRLNKKKNKEKFRSRRNGSRREKLNSKT